MHQKKSVHCKDASNCYCDTSARLLLVSSVADPENPFKAGVDNKNVHGATRETENIVEGRTNRFNSILHNIKCISLYKKAVNSIVLTSW